MPEAAGTKTIRGTQSFVAVMAQVWRRPSLTALEVLWRWAAGAPLLVLLAVELLRMRRVVAMDLGTLKSVTVFEPVAAFQTVDTLLAAAWLALRPVALWLLPLAFVVWITAGAFGRARVMRRLSRSLPDAHGPGVRDPGRRQQSVHLSGHPSTLLALGAVRALALVAVWGLWAWCVYWAGQVAILHPARSGGEPSLIGYCALLICGTLGLFVAWAAGSWLVHLAPLEAMLGSKDAAASLRSALLSSEVSRALRARLIETNLVMGIVKIALLVLATVFSACPLPFSSVESPAFLTAWWCGVGLLYLAAMDFFHVAHAAAYVQLWRAYNFPRER